MSASQKRQANLADLSDEIHAVYRNLLQENDLPTSTTSLGSVDNNHSYHTPRLDNAFILTHLSPYRLQDDLELDTRSGAHSAPMSPLLSSSLEIHPALSSRFKALTNSSLDVVVDNGTPEPMYPSYSPYDDNRKLNQTYSLREDHDALEVTPERSSSAIDEEEDWTERGAAETVKSGPGGSTVVRRTVKDFEFGKDLGEGSYSTVVLATDKLTKRQYAVKVLDKRHIIKEKKVKYVNIEKHALNRLTGLNGIISLFFTFQDKDSLYYVLDYASKGELLGLIKTYGTLNEDCTRHFGVQILDAIKNMHDNGIIHRDIKPENILLDDQFRIRITDFGTAKLLERKVNEESGEPQDYPLDVRAKSFVGTAEYVSPELLESKYCGKPGDIWAFGCILYQMIAGKPPFKATNDYLTFQKITKLQYAFSAGFPLILRDLIKLILVLRPSRRATISQIQEHPFFEKCDFKNPDSFWKANPPEITPYKVTAQSMMKMPPKHAPAAAKVASKKNTTQASKTSPIITKVASKSAGDKGGREFTPASVAAFVLTKDEDSAPESPKTPTEQTPPVSKSIQTGSVLSRSVSTPDYIPGTNILRPQVNNMANFSRGSVNSHKSDSETRRPRPRTKELAPSTAVEAAWQQYLSPDERIIHVGSVSATKKTTEAFERKYKGFVHDSPLGFTNQLKGANQRIQSKSLLSRYVRDNQSNDSKDSCSEVESDAITFFYEEVQVSTQGTIDEEDKGSLLGIGHGKFGKSLRKLLANGDKKSVETIFEDGTVTRQAVSLERPRTCTVLITTFGRVLLFLRDDAHSDYKLICEVRLQYPFISFKEVVTSPSTKFGKQIPALGIFAIVSKIITFEFEVEKYDLNHWTDALARSKLSALERESASVEKLPSSPKLAQLPVLLPPIRSVSLPKLAQLPKPIPRSSTAQDLNASPLLRDHASSSGNVERLPSKKTQSVPPQRTLDPNHSHNHLTHKRLRSKEAYKRKAPPPPPVKNQHLSVTGFVEDMENGEKAVHAAQLAISNMHLSPNSRPHEHRASSFTKDNSRTYRNLSSSGNVTSMNSKLLARSRGAK